MINNSFCKFCNSSALCTGFYGSSWLFLFCFYCTKALSIVYAESIDNNIKLFNYFTCYTTAFMFLNENNYQLIHNNTIFIIIIIIILSLFLYKHYIYIYIYIYIYDLNNFIYNYIAIQL